MSTDIPPEEQERLARELAESLRNLRVEDVLVNTLMTVSSIGYRRLGATDETREDRDLEQTRLAIETMRALTPVLEGFLPAELVRDFNSSVANLQLAYAQAVRVAPTDAPAAPADAPADGPADAATDEPAARRDAPAARVDAPTDPPAPPADAAPDAPTDEPNRGD